MGYFCLNHHNNNIIQKKLRYWYWRFVYDRLTREKRRNFEQCIKNNINNQLLSLPEMIILLKRSKIAKERFLYWKKKAKQNNIYYKTLSKYIKDKPNPLYHDKAFFKKIPRFLQSFKIN